MWHAHHVAIYAYSFHRFYSAHCCSPTYSVDIVKRNFLLDPPKKNEQSFSSTLLHCNDDEKNNIRSKVNRFSLLLYNFIHTYTHTLSLYESAKSKLFMRCKRVTTKELYFLYVDIWEIKSKWWYMGLELI
jgi:hypothetical protein